MNSKRIYLPSARGELRKRYYVCCFIPQKNGKGVVMTYLANNFLYRSYIKPSMRLKYVPITEVSGENVYDFISKRRAVYWAGKYRHFNAVVVCAVVERAEKFSVVYPDTLKLRQKGIVVGKLSSAFNPCLGW